MHLVNCVVDNCDGVAVVKYQAPGEKPLAIEPFYVATCESCGAEWHTGVDGAATSRAIMPKPRRAWRWRRRG